MSPRRSTPLLVAASLLAQVAAAPLAGAADGGIDARPQPLYRYVDGAGRTVYANRPPPEGTPARVVPYAPSPPRRPAPPLAPQAPTATTAMPAHPKPPAPPARSQQQVLLEQLAQQIETLQSARNALKEGETVRNGDERNYQRYLDRMQGLRDAVTRQEGIVEALQNQLRLLGTASLAE